MFSLLLFIATGALAWYVREGIAHKVEVVRAHHVKEKQNKNLEFGNQLRSDSEKLNDQEEVIKGAFLDVSAVVPFISGLEITGQNLGLEVVVEKVEYGTEEIISQNTLQPITFFVQLVGSYIQIESFLTSLSYSKNILKTNELKLYKTEGGIYTARIIIQGTILK